MKTITIFGKELVISNMLIGVLGVIIVGSVIGVIIALSVIFTTAITPVPNIQTFTNYMPPTVPQSTTGGFYCTPTCNATLSCCGATYQNGSAYFDNTCSAKNCSVDVSSTATFYECALCCSGISDTSIRCSGNSTCSKC